jgi:hypothetical protein
MDANRVVEPESIPVKIGEVDAVLESVWVTDAAEPVPGVQMFGPTRREQTKLRVGDVVLPVHGAIAVGGADETGFTLLISLRAERA